MKLEPKLEIKKNISYVEKIEKHKIHEKLQYSDKINNPDQVEILESIKSNNVRHITLDKLD